MPAADLGAERRARLASARLYLVCGAIDDRAPSDRPRAGGRGLLDLLAAAISGGVDIVQLREKHLDDEQLAAVAGPARELCERLRVPLIVNDRPLLARKIGADGVHVGQDDMPVAQVRELVGPDMLIGLSTHAPQEIDAEAAALADYIGVGPVHETPTKPGRPAVGLGLIRYAAEHSRVPFFAIGGLHARNLGQAIDAGARRAVVLRAIGEAADPQSAARELRGLLDAAPLEP
jgi:thiamine-phosphate pyrophosphorylase